MIKILTNQFVPFGWEAIPDQPGYCQPEEEEQELLKYARDLVEKGRLGRTQVYNVIRALYPEIRINSQNLMVAIKNNINEEEV